MMKCVSSCVCFVCCLMMDVEGTEIEEPISTLLDYPHIDMKKSHPSPRGVL